MFRLSSLYRDYCAVHVHSYQTFTALYRNSSVSASAIIVDIERGQSRSETTEKRAHCLNHRSAHAPFLLSCPEQVPGAIS